MCFQFTFIGGEPRPKSLKDFSWEKSSFSRKANTAKEFTGIWDIHVAPCLDKKTGEYKKSSSQATTAPHEASAAAHKNTGPHNMQKRSSEVLPLELPKPKKQKQDSKEEEHKEQDKRIDGCFVGKCM